jgi:hypothetical protein
MGVENGKGKEVRRERERRARGSGQGTYLRTDARSRCSLPKPWRMEKEEKGWSTRRNRSRWPCHRS